MNTFEGGETPVDESDGSALHSQVANRDRPLDFHWSVDRNAVERAGCRATGTSNFDRAMRSTMAALVLSDRAGGGWVSYSRRRGFYAGKARYQGLPYSYTNVLKVVDELVRLGLAEDERALPGDHLRTGRQSRIRATPKLALAFEGVRLAFDPHEVIRLKDSDSKILAYTDTDRTFRMRREIVAINQALSSVSLTLPAECIPRGDEHVVVGGAVIRITPSPVLYRVFNRGEWTKNGRVYWWGQNLPTDSRAGMLMNGERVIEIDFAAMHPRMLYAQLGLSLGFDPYEIPGFSRRHAKRALLISINATSRPSAIGAMLDWVDRNGAPWPHDRATTGRLFDAVVAHNHAIADKIGSDAGIDLMRDDSEITIRVVKRCLALKIACLPVHDSFIAQARHKAALEAIMDEEMKRYESRARARAADKRKQLKNSEEDNSGSTYGKGVRVGEAGVHDVNSSIQTLAVSPVSVKVAKLTPMGAAGRLPPKSSTRTSKPPSFDRAEQRRREEARRLDPSLEYIPTPGESESVLWSLYGDGYVEVLKQMKRDEGRNRNDFFRAATDAERLAGRRLPRNQGGTLPNAA